MVYTSYGCSVDTGCVASHHITLLHVVPSGSLCMRAGQSLLLIHLHPNIVLHSIVRSLVIVGLFGALIVPHLILCQPELSEHLVTTHFECRGLGFIPSSVAWLFPLLGIGYMHRPLGKERIYRQNSTSTYLCLFCTKLASHASVGSDADIYLWGACAGFGGVLQFCDVPKTRPHLHCLWMARPRAGSR